MFACRCYQSAKCVSPSIQVLKNAKQLLGHTVARTQTMQWIPWKLARAIDRNDHPLNSHSIFTKSLQMFGEQ